MAFRYLRTKLQPPLLRDEKLVSRPRLDTLLDGNDFGAVTLVSATAGFGKTTVVADWARNREETVCWYSIDRRDNDPERFFGYLVTALQTAWSDLGARLLHALEAPELPDLETLMIGLLNEISEVESPGTLVLDDLHAVENRAIYTALALLVENLPPQLRLVILSREDPPLALPRLRGSGRLNEVRARDLCFSEEETGAFLNGRMKLDLDREAIGRLEERTEGWIAAVQMAGLSIVGRPNPEQFIASFAGTNRFILDYLMEEVLARQSDTGREFLFKTSILETLSGPLCDAVTGRDDGQEMLESLERSNMLLVPLDDRREWYRYHQLFADILRAQTKQHRKADLSDWHSRASRWYDQKGDRRSAIAHAFSSGDQELAADLIERTWPELAYGVRPMTWLSWAEELPSSEVEKRPVLSAAVAWMLLDKGETEGAEGRLEVAEAWIEGKSGPAGRVSNWAEYRFLPGSSQAARAYLSLIRGEFREAGEHAKSARRLLPPEASFWHGTAYLFLGLARWWEGDLEDAYVAIEESVRSQRLAGNYYYHAFGMVLLAEIRMAQGRLGDANKRYDRILGPADSEEASPAEERRELIQDPVALYAGLGELYRLRGELDEADLHLTRGTEIRRQAVLPATAYRLYTARARLHESRRDFDLALEDLEEAARLQRPGAVPDLYPIDALRARLLLRQGRLREATAWANGRPEATDEPPTVLDQFGHLTRTRVRLAVAGERGDDETLNTLLKRLDDLAQAASEVGYATISVEALILESIALDRMDDRDTAAASVSRAARIAEPEGIVQPFLDEGASLLPALRIALTRGENPLFFRSLITAFQTEVGETPSAEAANQLLIEPLSPRELDVLELVAQGKTNQEVGEELFISLSTVKKHLNNLFGKLTARNRTEALRRARDLGLL